MWYNASKRTKLPICIRLNGTFVELCLHTDCLEHTVSIVSFTVPQNEERVEYDLPKSSTARSHDRTGHLGLPVDFLDGLHVVHEQ